MTKTTDGGPDWADLAALEVCDELSDYIPGHLQHLHAVKVIAQAIRDQPGRQPDYCFDLNDWEFTQQWSDSDYITEDILVGETMAIGTLMKGPRKYAAHVVLTTDGEGDPVKTEIQWFDSEEDAKKAVDAKPGEGE